MTSPRRRASSRAASTSLLPDARALQAGAHRKLADIERIALDLREHAAYEVIGALGKQQRPFVRIRLHRLRCQPQRR